MGEHTAWLTNDGIVFDVQRPLESNDAVATAASSKALLSDQSRLPASRERDVRDRKLDRLVFSEKFLGAACCLQIEGRAPTAGVYNFFQGNDSAQWRTNVHGFAEVIYHNVWPKIDLRVYGNGPNLEQEFVVQPDGNLSNVQISYLGIDGLTLTTDGSLEVNTAFGKLRETKPRLYQEIAGKHVAVNGRFRLVDAKSYTFATGAHSSEFALVIDPTLLYSTFLGGSATDAAAGIAVDASGNAYIYGTTYSLDFPTTPGAFQTNRNTAVTAFITKLNPAGSGLVYSTYLQDSPFVGGIAVDASGNVYVTGETLGSYYAGTIFPTTANAYSQTCGSYDGFLTVLNPQGTDLVYSTCFGIGFDANYSHVTAITADAHGRASITGSIGYPFTIPTTSNAFQASFPGGGTSAFVIVLDTTASGTSSLLYSSYLGSPSVPFNYRQSDGTAGSGIAVDAFGNLYVTGNAGEGFPVTAGALQTNYAGGGDTFVAKIDPFVSGTSSLIYATYLGGCGSDSATGIAVDASGSAYITGTSQSTCGPFPTTPGAFQTSAPYNAQAGFVAKLNAAGSSLVYSTYVVGPAGRLNSNGIAVDALGNALITGNSQSNSVPVTPDAFQNTFQGGLDAFITELNPTGSALLYSSYLGGGQDDVATAVAVDLAGDAYVAGYTGSPNFPVSSTALQPILNLGGGTQPQDAFVAKFPVGAAQTLSISSLQPTSGGNGGTVTINIQGGGFHNGASVSLIGGATIMGNASAVGSEGRTISVTLDLTGTLVGSYSLVVTNPDGATTSLPNAFTVLSGGGSKIGLSLTGLAVNHGSNTKVVLEANISNKGTVDLPSGFVVMPLGSSFSLTSSSPAGLINLAQSSSAGFTVVTSVPTAPGSSQTITATESSTVLTSCDSPPLGAQACFIPDDCNINQANLKTCIGSALIIEAGCAAVLEACVEGIGEVSPWTFLGCVAAGAACSYSEHVALDHCLTEPSVVVCQSGTPICFSGQLPCVHAVDPNGLVGPSGIGGQRWISGTQALTYVIAFNNEPTAAVPAQQVIVTQPLGPSVNFSNLGLLGITIPNGANDVQTSVPAAAFNPSVGMNEFITNVDLRPTQNLLVNVDALLKPATQTLTWSLTSIDPATGQPPVDPQIGFLPPGAGATVSYLVTPQQGLATGTQIAEQASVVFDGQAPMSTAAWSNTIDNTPPVSHVSALAATSNCPNFRVSWSGSDVGSGLQGFTIYVSDTGAPYTAWLSNTTAASAIYQGVIGYTYSFYSIATDLAGNVEGAKTSAEASTTVTAATSCGAPSLGGQVSDISQSGPTVTLNLQLTNNGFTAAQVVNINQITFRTLSGSGTVTLASPLLPAAEGPLDIGESTTVALTLNVPTTVMRFSVTEGGNLKDDAGNTYNYSIAQTVIP